MRGRRRALALLTLLGVVLAGANAWLFVHREEGYAYAVGSYATAYWPTELPAIARLERSGAGFEVHFAPGADPRWQPGGAEPLRAEAGSARHAVRFGRDANAPGFEIDTFVPPDPNGMLFGSHEIPFADAPRLPLRELVANPEDYAPEDLARVRERLAALDLDPAAATEERLAKLWLALHDELESHRGVPPPGLERLPAYEQYRRALAGEAKLYCANFAAILTLFATAAGIPARTVDALGDHDGVHLGAHTFVEVFLPERQRWAYTDLTNRVFLVRAGASGPPLNAIQIAEAQRAGIEDVLVAIQPHDGALAAGPLRAARQTELALEPGATYVFQRDYRARHSLTARLLRWAIAPEPAYRLDGNAAPYRLKTAVLWATAATAVAWVIAATRTRRSGGSRLRAKRGI